MCLNLLHIIPSLDSACGGPSRSVPLLCAWLVRSKSTKVRIVTAVIPTQGGGVPVSEVSLRDLRTRAVLDASADALHHVHALWNPFSTLAMRSLRRAKYPYVLSLRGMLRPETIGSRKKRFWARMWERANVAGAAAVHVTSADELEATRACGWRLPPVALIPNPVEIPEFCHTVYSDGPVRLNGRPSILYVGRLSGIKRLDLLLRAFALVHKQAVNAELIFAGPDSEGILHELKRTARQQGIAHRVTFLGMQTQAQLGTLFRQASVAALVSQRENFGMAAAEAMAHGVPVVLTKHVGVAREAEEAGGAIVVDDSPESIADGLLTMLNDYGRSQLMSRRARALVEQRYSPPRVAEMMLSVYKWVLGQGPQPDCVRVN